MSAPIPSWTDSETQTLRLVLARSHRIYGLLVLLAAVVGFGLASGQWALLPLGARILSLAVVVFWLVVLLSKLRFLAQVRADLAGDPVEHCGPFLILPRRGIGLLAPLRFELLAGPLRAHVLNPLPDLTGDTGRYRLRVGAKSRLLVSLSPLGEAPVCSDRRAEQAESGPVPTLTEREQQLLRALAAGLPDKLIARELGLTPATVRTYNSALFRKLGLADREAAIAWAKAQTADGAAASVPAGSE